MASLHSRSLVQNSEICSTVREWCDLYPLTNSQINFPVVKVAECIPMNGWKQISHIHLKCFFTVYFYNAIHVDFTTKKKGVSAAVFILKPSPFWWLYKYYMQSLQQSFCNSSTAMWESKRSCMGQCEHSKKAVQQIYELFGVALVVLQCSFTGV